MVTSNMSLPIDVGNDELIILLWRYHERFEEGCGKGGGVEGGGGIPKEPLPVAGSKTNQILVGLISWV